MFHGLCYYLFVTVCFLPEQYTKNVLFSAGLKGCCIFFMRRGDKKEQAEGYDLLPVEGMLEVEKFYSFISRLLVTETAPPSIAFLEASRYSLMLSTVPSSVAWPSSTVTVTWSRST